MSWIVKLMDAVESGLRKVDDDLNSVQRDAWGQVIEPHVQHQGEEENQ